MRLFLMILALLFAAAPAHAANLDRSQLVLTWWDEFGRPPNLQHPAMNPRGTWKTTFVHGEQDDARPNGWDSRTLKGNGELQVYTGGMAGVASPFRVEGGKLVITAAPITPALKARWGERFKYTSGLLTTETSFAQRYGYFEIRAAVPEGRGLWPAFWLLPVEKDGAGNPRWPPEIDVMEQLGHEPGAYYGTVHWADAKTKKHQQSGGAVKRKWLAGRMTSYGLLWTPKELVWYLDDVEVRRVPNPGIHEPMYMLVNLAVGGAWPGAPDAKTKFPAELRVDHVRAYAIRAAE